MNTILIQDAAGIAQAADIAFSTHARLREAYPWLPAHRKEDFIGRIGWMAEQGRVYGLVQEADGPLEAFLAWFPLDEYRNLGRAALSPDWSWGLRSVGNGQGGKAAAGPGIASQANNRREARRVSRLLSPLVRRLLADLREEGLSIHAIGIPAREPALLEEFSLLSWGRTVLDAARPAHELLASLPVWQEDSADSDAPSLVVRRARPADAEALARLDQSLAAHIAAPPVLMPDTRPSTVVEWREWLESPENLAVVAECDGRAVGFMKAAPPQMDVSWFVHSPNTLAICGLWVDPSCRGRHLGERLLRFLVTSGLAHHRDNPESGSGDDMELLVSVDCETHNPEARAFWLSHFEPVTWSFERRF